MKYSRDTSGLKKIADGIYKKTDNFYYIRCSVSELLYPCSLDRLNDLEKKYGSKEKIAQTFVGRHVKSLLKSGVPRDTIADLPVKHIINESKEVIKLVKEVLVKKKEEKELEPPKKEYTPIYFTEPTSFKNALGSPEEIARVTKASGCMRQDIYLDNHRTCNLCPFVKDCACELKRVK